MARSILRSILRPLSLVACVSFLALPALAGPPGGGGSITLYDGGGFRGEAVRFDGAVARLPRAQFNDRASSVSLRGGAWELCSDSNFRGRCETVTGDIGDLRRIGLNDNISSLRPVGRDHALRGDDRGRYRDHDAPRRRVADVILFDGEGFEGRALPLDGPVARMGDFRGNDRASSIVVNRGAWLVCEHADFRGHCAVVDRSTPSLRGVGLNNSISSVKPYRGGYGALYGGDEDGYSRRGWN